MDFEGAALPGDDPARLREWLDLNILDSEADQAFDDLARLAARICDAPMAFISLIDRDRQWMKARVGLTLRELPRRLSFCVHALQTPQSLFEVPDTTRDARFAHHPMVVGEPGLRFYAAMPLSIGGAAVGTLAVLDHRPRRLTDDQAFALRTLAASVATRLALRHRPANDAGGRDVATGLPGSVAFERAFERSADPARGGTCLVIASSRLNRVAAALGAPSVEAVLQEVVRRLGTGLPDGVMLSFLRRGLFTVFVDGLTDRASIETMMRALQARLDEPYRVVETELLSWFGCPWQIGAARFPQDGQTAIELIVAAEQAMTRAQGATAALALYDSVDRHAAADELRLEGELRRALADGGLVLHYQPKVDLRTGTVVALEALIRWSHPERGWVLPGEFLPAIDAAGLSRALSRFVVLQAVCEWSDWHARGLRPPPIAVNIGAAELLEPDVADFFANALRLAPSGGPVLSIEITEGALVADPAAAARVLQRLREIGVSVAIDDFGTGYSSLAYLSTLPIDEIKIDRAFIATMLDDDAQRVLVETLISLGGRLRRRIVAEGVETRAQHDALCRMGCDQAQGFFYDRALPAARIVERLPQAGPWRAASALPPVDRSRDSAIVLPLTGSPSLAFSGPSSPGRHDLLGRFPDGGGGGAAGAERYRWLAEYSSDIILLAEDDVVAYVSPSAGELLGWTPQQVIGRPLAEFCHRDDFERARSRVLSRDRRATPDLRVRVAHRDGHYVWMEARGRQLPVRDRSGRRRRVINLRDIAARQVIEEELERVRSRLLTLATTDPLTGLANRRKFDEALALEFRRAMRDRTPLSLLMIDIDHFKRLNDTHGHLVGDEVLRQLGGWLAGWPRRAGDLVARLGGEEFAMLLPNVELPVARAMAADLVARAADTSFSAPVEQLTCSVGTACLSPPMEGDSPALLVQRADDALYVAKRSGRNRAH